MSDKHSFKKLLLSLERTADWTEREAIAQEALDIAATFRGWPFVMWSEETVMASLHAAIGQSLFNLRPRPSEPELRKIIEHLSNALPLTRSHAGPEVIYILQGLSESYFKLFEMTGEPDSHRLALEYLDRALPFVEMTGDPVVLAEMLDGAGDLAGLSPNLPAVEAASLSVAYLSKAHSLLSDRSPRQLRGRIKTKLASHLVQLAEAKSQRVDEDVIKLLETGLEELSVHEFPMQWGSTQIVLAQAYMLREQGLIIDNEREALEAIDRAIKAFSDAGLVHYRALGLVTRGNHLVSRTFKEPFDSQQALELFEAAEQLNDEALHPEQVFDIRQNISNLLDQMPPQKRKERSSSLRRYFERIIEQSATASSDPLSARAHMQLGNLLYGMHRDRRGPEGEEALHHLQIAADLLSKSGDHGALLVTMGNLASAYADRSVGDPNENIELALKLQEQMLEAREPSTDPRDWAQDARNLALTYKDKRTGHEADNLELAISTLEEALVVMTETHHPQIRATLLESLGDCYQSRPRGEEEDNAAQVARLYRFALRCLSGLAEKTTLQRIIAKRHRVLSVHGPETEQVETSNAKSDVDAYFKGYEASIAEAREKGLVFPLMKALLDYGDALRGHGSSYLQKGDEDLWPAQERALKQALVQYDEARSLISEEYDREKCASIEEKKARIYSLLAQFSSLEDVGLDNVKALFSPESEHLSERTRDYLKQSIAHYSASLELNEPHCFSRTREGLLYEIAHNYALLRDWERAGSNFKKASDASTALAVDIAITRSELASQFRRFSSMIELGAFSLLRAGKSLSALAFADATRARLLARTLNFNTIEMPNDKRALVDAYRKELAGLEARLLSPDLFLRRPLIERISEVRGVLASTLSPFWERDDGKLEDTLLSLLDDRTAIVAPVLSSLGGAVLLVRSEEGKLVIEEIEAPNSIAFSGLFTNDKEGWLSQYRAAVNAMAAASNSADQLLTRAIETSSNAVRELFVGPLQSRLGGAQLKGIERLVLVPQEGLAQLPLSATISEDGEHLIERVELATLPSVSVGGALRRQRPEAKGHAITFGVVEWALNMGHYDHSKHECALASWFAGGASRFLSAEEGAEDESEALRALSEGRVWHFSSHGAFDPSKPLNSSIEISPDKRLTLRALFEANHLAPPDLVVLSACETGVYDEEAPNEFLGWPTAFLQLGARGVVATLWPVESFPTTLLMAKFYELAFCKIDVSVSAALRQAQLWLKDTTVADVRSQIEAWLRDGALSNEDARELLEDPSHWDLSDDERAFSNPAHWAGFVFYGHPDLVLGNPDASREDENE